MLLYIDRKTRVRCSETISGISDEQNFCPCFRIREVKTTIQIKPKNWVHHGITMHIVLNWELRLRRHHKLPLSLRTLSIGIENA